MDRNDGATRCLSMDKNLILNQSMISLYHVKLVEP